MPEPRDDEVLVRVRAAAINPGDVKNAAAQFHQTVLPRTPGRDFSGVIEESGTPVWATGGELGYTRRWRPRRIRRHPPGCRAYETGRSQL